MSQEGGVMAETVVKGERGGWGEVLEVGGVRAELAEVWELVGVGVDGGGGRGGVGRVGAGERGTVVVCCSVLPVVGDWGLVETCVEEAAGGRGEKGEPEEGFLREVGLGLGMGVCLVNHTHNIKFSGVTTLVVAVCKCPYTHNSDASSNYVCHMLTCLLDFKTGMAHDIIKGVKSVASPMMVGFQHI